MPTPRGIWVLTFAVGLYVLTLASGYQALAVLAAAGLGAQVVAVAWISFRPRVSVTRTIEPTAVARGNPAFGLVSVRNEQRGRSFSATAVEHVGGRRLTLSIPHLAGGRSMRCVIRLPTERRGAYDVGPLELVRFDPFGLWRVAARAGDVRRLWVHPRTRNLKGMPAGRTRSYDGATTRAVSQAAIAFHALREYVVGDDMRRVHWRSTARTGTLIVREHVDTSLPAVVIVLDVDHSVYDDDESFEIAVEVAGSLAVTAAALEFPVRILTTSGNEMNSTGQFSGREALNFLACVDMARSSGLVAAVHRAAHSRQRDTLAVVTGRLAPDDARAVTSTGQRFSHSSLVTVDPNRQAASAVGKGGSGVAITASSLDEFVSQWNRSVRR